MYLFVCVCLSIYQSDSQVSKDVLELRMTLNSSFFYCLNLPSTSVTSQFTYLIIHICLIYCVYVHACHSTCVEVRSNLQCGSLELNFGYPYPLSHYTGPGPPAPPLFLILQFFTVDREVLYPELYLKPVFRVLYVCMFLNISGENITLEVYKNLAFKQY